MRDKCVSVLKGMSARENTGTLGLSTLCLSATGAGTVLVIYLRLKAHSGTVAFVDTCLIHHVT